MTIKVRTQRDICRNNLDVAITRDAHGGCAIMETPIWRVLTDGEFYEPTFLRNGQDFLQACLDAAWDAGLRPAGYLDTRESLKHIDAHLQDMRKLAFMATQTVVNVGPMTAGEIRAKDWRMQS